MIVEIPFPDFGEFVQVLGEIKTGLEEIKTPGKQWYSLRAAWELKGGCAWNTLRTNRWLQPLGGLFEGKVGGVGVFRRETVEEWVGLTDDALAAYHEKYCTGAKRIR